MLVCRLMLSVAMVVVAKLAPAQAIQKDVANSDGWRAPDKGDSAHRVVASTQNSHSVPSQSDSGTDVNALPGTGRKDREVLTRVTKGSGTLPNAQGQIWREYDISPYTLRVTSTRQPEQAIVDWILRETGYETWHSEPVAMLSASNRVLRVYHTPEMQQTVAQIVDRFVNTQADTHAFGLRIVTVGNPNWRAKSLRLMKSVPVQTQGVQGWLMAKEDAAFLLAELNNRTDFREHSSPHLLVSNGQSTVVSAIRPRKYIRGIIPSDHAWPGFNPDVGQLDEGYSLQFNPLLSLDGNTIDAIIKLQLNQIEKMVPVTLDVPTQIAPRQRTRVEVPQMTMVHIHERFRWPSNQVLLLSMGVVATPAPSRANPIADVLALPTSPPRADALLFVESRGKVVSASTTRPVSGRPSNVHTQRY